MLQQRITKREEAFNYLVSFLMSFASRTGTRDRLHLFTTNYDRLIEAGAETAGMHLLDRFVGTLAPIFRSSRLDLDMHYNPPGIRGEPRYLEGVARFTKLHGSLDWVNRERNILRLGIPFGAEKLEPYLNNPSTGENSGTQLMIYPNAAKDRETSAYPYVELFRDFAAAACRPNHTLVSYGYSFGDEHINRVIEDMLTIPSTHLVVISYDDPLGRIMKTYERLGRHAQVSLLIGDHLGDFKTLVDHYLPKPAIDRTTFRMAELLKSRWGTTQELDKESTESKDKSEGVEILIYTPFAHAESLRIGTVDFISPDEIKVMLDIEAPESVALNAGGVRPFPRINSYILMPVDDGYLVGQIEWMTIERLAFPKRRGMQDFGLIDLPYPLRKMSLNPLGTLRKQGEPDSYVFRRGADALPSVGSPVILPTEKQLRSIVESGNRRRISIGISPIAANATVSVDPDRLFGRHLAVLGNTGSGKSCSVVGLIRWSLEEAAKAKNQDKSKPNARFIVLDPNGEYARAFADSGDIKARVFKVNPKAGELALKVPLWFWNSAEWCSFTQASAKT